MVLFQQQQKNTRGKWVKPVLFKSLRNSKRCNKGNFMSKSDSNKIKLCGGGRQHYLVLNKISKNKESLNLTQKVNL